MTAMQATLPETASAAHPAQSGWMDLLLLFARRKRVLILTAVITGALASVAAFLLPDVYTARTLILPPQQTQSILPTLVGQYGALAGLGSRDFSMRSTSDLFAAMMTSETVQTDLIRQYGLMSLYHVKRMEDARKKLTRNTTVTVMPKEGLIQLEVDDRDPRRAADLANGYVERLGRINARLALTEASQRRAFFEREIQTVRQELEQAETAMKRTQESTGLLQLDAQSKAVIQAVAGIKAEVAAKEIQIRSMATFATDRNPGMVSAREELAGLRAQLAAIQSRGGGAGDTQIPTRKVPEVSLVYMRSFRNLAYQESLLEVLAKHYEAARIDEAKSTPEIGVIDPATPPEKNSGPRRALLIPGAVLAAVFCAVLGIACADAYRRSALDPDQGAKLALLKNYLKS